MKIIPKTRKFQTGGAIAPEEVPAEEPMTEAPEEGAAPAESQDPMAMLVQGAMQAVQSLDCQVAMQVCQMLVQLVQQSQGGAPQGEPYYKKGGKFAGRIRN